MKVVAALILFPVRLLVVVLLISLVAASGMSAAFHDHDQSRLSS
jgi:hypothetical protein